jgi:hypothetical protein
MVLAVACAGCSKRPTAPAASKHEPMAAESMARGLAWLSSHQAEDGGWHSKVYGQMRGGVGDTALVTYALAQLTAGQPSARDLATAKERSTLAIEFLLAQLADPQHPERRASADYPTYAAALLLLALDPSTDNDCLPNQEQVQGVLEYLKSSQQTAARGWQPDDPRFGGWNQTGADATEDGRRPGNTNISVTYFALGARRAHGALDTDTGAAAQAFLARCQNFGEGVAAPDGGFFFTPDADDPLNKAGEAPNARPARARSYGSTTADGLCALAATGARSDDPRVKAAIAWLVQQQSIERVPGFAADDADQSALGASAADGLKYYYAAALARAIRAYPNAEFAKRKPAMIEWLLREQRPDGSWQNSNNVMREDDPLIATSFAIVALSLLSAD